ncbi:MAG TPA: DUF6164 family protein [Luteimonas sp.]|nr:DUF6164 family protein [Luteimonas sp.]
MATLLLSLRMVPDDESEGVRAFLAAAGIDFYETTASRWGISHGGIWVSDDADLPRARRLMSDFQAQRSAHAREAQAAALRDGSAETFADVARREPLRVALTALAILVLLGLVALPVLILRG